MNPTTPPFVLGNSQPATPSASAVVPADVRTEFYELCEQILCEAINARTNASCRERLRYLRGALAGIQVADKAEAWGSVKSPWLLLAAKVDALLQIGGFRELRKCLVRVLVSLRSGRDYIITGANDTA